MTRRDECRYESREDLKAEQEVLTDDMKVSEKQMKYCQETIETGQDELKNELTAVREDVEVNIKGVEGKIEVVKKELQEKFMK